MWEDASAQTRGGTGRRPRSVEIKRAERWLKQKCSVFLTNTHLPPPPQKNPNQTTRPKPKSEATAITGCTKKHQDADANRCDHGPEVIPENGSYSSFSLTLLLNMLLVPAREKIKAKVSLWPEPVQMFQWSWSHYWLTSWELILENNLHFIPDNTQTYNSWKPLIWFLATFYFRPSSCWFLLAYFISALKIHPILTYCETHCNKQPYKLMSAVCPQIIPKSPFTAACPCALTLN